jgi:hypothetical protein
MDNGDRKNFMRLIDPSRYESIPLVFILDADLTFRSGQPLTDSQLLWTDTDYGRSDMVLSTAGKCFACPT